MLFRSAAIKSAGVTRYRIARETGIDEAALSRFMSGERGLDLSTVDRLAAYLGLQLTGVENERRK